MATFTEYVRPNGRQRPIDIDLPFDVERLAKELIGDGCALECEILRTGEVSLTIDRENTDGDMDTLAHEIVPNGPGVKDAVIKLIKTAHDSRAGEIRQVEPE